jgi:flavin reductase (DIM6/NTAB) family NADH-FMN oxidoreductase RutF
MVKVEIPVRAPEGTDFPSHVPWFFSNILLPYPLYIITTVDGNGIPNAQPNSWGLPYGSGDVQMFLFSCWTTHHTYENVLETGEFVVNIPAIDFVKEVMRTVEHYPRGVDEIEASGLTALASARVKAPRIGECKAHLECTYLWSQTVPLWEDVENAVIAGQVVAASADEDILHGRGVSKLAALRAPYITNRSVDASSWTATGPQLCGLVGQVKDFWEMTRNDKEDP